MCNGVLVLSAQEEATIVVAAKYPENLEIYKTETTRPVKTWFENNEKTEGSC